MYAWRPFAIHTPKIMSLAEVPPVPEATVPARDSASGSGTNTTASKRIDFLDAHFVRRIYWSMAWFCGLMGFISLWAWPLAAQRVSFIGGMLLAALLLWTQEILVSAVLGGRREPGQKANPRLGLLALIPVKYGAVGVALVVAQSLRLLDPAAMAVGFFLAQCVIVAKIIGRMAVRAQRMAG